MFGYVAAELTALDKDSAERYHSVYCGVCRGLSERCGGKGRLTLTFDAAFLGLLLSSAAGEAFEAKDARCALHPVRGCKRLENRFTQYAADMNILLMYEKLLDDVADENSVVGRLGSQALRKDCEAVRELYPRQSAAIDNGLRLLHEMERDGVHKPDLPADVVGAMTAEIFAYEEGGPKESELRSFGRALGRFVYLMDAELDLEGDLKHGRYNPLLGLEGVTGGEVLWAQSLEVMRCFDALGIVDDEGLLRNVLEKGTWLRYDARETRRRKKNDEKSI